MSKLIDLTGQTYGRLTVLKHVGRAANRSSLWRCRCSCGNETTLPSSAMRTGNTKSCGCLHREEQSARITERNRREIVGYTGAHRRATTIKGPAAEQSCMDCGTTADEWSYTHEDPDELHDDKGRPFSLNLDHYVPRCRSCHRLLDCNRVA